MRTEERHAGPDVLPPAAAARYVDLRYLGRGGMGAVYGARDTASGLEVALKIMRPDFEENHAYRKRFRREVEAMARVDHPNVVPIIEYHHEAGIEFFTMARLRGKTLREMIRQGTVGIDRVAHLGQQVADALQALHDAGLVHRDVKPSNIMVDPEGKAVLMDFGLVMVEDDEGRTVLTRTGQIVGTMRYLAPEAFLGQRATPRSDVYQLGVVLYHALAGRHPYEGFSVKDIAEGRAAAWVPPLSRVASPCDPGLARVVERAMQPRASERFPSAAAMRDALRECRVGSGALPRSVNSEGPAPAPRWARGLALAVLAAALVGLTLLNLLR